MLEVVGAAAMPSACMDAGEARTKAARARARARRDSPTPEMLEAQKQGQALLESLSYGTNQPPTVVTSRSFVHRKKRGEGRRGRHSKDVDFYLTYFSCAFTVY